MNKKNRHRLIFYVVALAFPLLQFFIFYIYVNFNSVLLAFRQYEYTSNEWSFVWFDNLKLVINNFLTDVGIQQSMWNTLEVFLILLITKFIPIVMSFYLFKKYPMYKLFTVFLFLPQIISSMALVLCYRYFVERALPLIWEAISGNSIEGLLFNSSTTWGTLVFYAVWFSMGAQFLLYAGAMSGISDSVIEAAELDGVNAFQEFIYIIFPMIYPTFVTFIITSFALLFTYQLNLYSFFGDGAEYSVSTIGYLLYVKTVSASIGDYPYLSAAGIMLTVIAVPLCLIVKWLLNKLGPKTI